MSGDPLMLGDFLSLSYKPLLGVGFDSLSAQFYSFPYQPEPWLCQPSPRPMAWKVLFIDSPETPS